MHICDLSVYDHKIWAAEVRGASLDLIFLLSSLFKGITLHYENLTLFPTFRSWCQLDFCFIKQRRRQDKDIGLRNEWYSFLGLTPFYPLDTSLNVEKSFKAKSVKSAALCQ